MDVRKRVENCPSFSATHSQPKGLDEEKHRIMRCFSFVRVLMYPRVFNYSGINVKVKLNLDILAVDGDLPYIPLYQSSNGGKLTGA